MSGPIRVRLKSRTLRVLDFDIENRPLSYLGHDFTTSDITAIAWSWMDEEHVEARLLGKHTTKQMLLDFLRAYERADVVTGHYIRKHDLPIVSGAMLEAGYGPLPAKASSDTKLDLRKRGGVSASQESLADMLGVELPKYHMDQAKWRLANRLTPKGISETKTRVVGDVRQHKALRAALLERGWLGPARMWRP